MKMTQRERRLEVVEAWRERDKKKENALGSRKTAGLYSLWEILRSAW